MNKSNLTTLFETSVALVLEETKGIKELQRLARSKRHQFAIDTCLVAHGVRTGYLVDAVCPPNPTTTFATLLTTLRRKSAVFKDVMVWHHAPTMQTFLVHVPLLREKITVLLDGARECVFIKLDKCLSVLGGPSHGLQEALRNVALVMEHSPDMLMFSLSELFAEELLVPLAAVVIDYPVAYIPSMPTFLQGEALDIYTVSFKWKPDSTLGVETEHVLLKFSCPRVLASDYPELSPSIMIPKLRVKFASSLERVGMCILVTHRTKALERVAL